MLEVSGLEKRFGGIRAVDGVSFSLEAGSITGLMGANGAGKTTLFNLVTGYLQPDAGTVRLHGRSLVGLPPFKIAQLGVARSFQDVRVFDRLSVLDNVMLAFQQQAGEHLLRLFWSFGRIRREERTRRAEAQELLELVGLARKAAARAGELSYGQQKLLSLARIFAMRAPLVLLDEPTAGVNPKLIQTMVALLRRMVEQGMTLWLIEHNWDAVSRLSDRLMFLDHGRLVWTGSVPDALTNAELTELYLGMRRPAGERGGPSA